MPNRMMLRLCALLVLLTPSAVAAQADLQTALVDRVVAIVGDSVILKSEVEADAQQRALADSTLPGPTDALYPEFLQQVLTNQVNELLVIQAAQNDTLIQVDEAAIDQQVADLIEQTARQFGGQPELQRVLREENGMTLAEYRDFRRRQLTRQQIMQLYMRRQAQDARPIEVTEDELRAQFEQVRPGLRQRPPQITFRQVVIRPEPSDSAKAAARAAIDTLLERARAGEDFAQLAEENSDDPGTASLGGDVGWFRRGSGFFKEFEDAAFALGQGRMGIVETPAGWHLILVERTRGRSEVKARHILKVPAVGPNDVERARDLARRVLERARGGESMGDLYEELGDPEEPDSLTIDLPQLSQLPASYAPLGTATVGAVLGPLDYQRGSASLSALRIAVVKVMGIREAGEYTFEDLRGALSANLQEVKRQDQILETLRANTYIDIRM